MRKLLLSSSALVAAASISSYAVADVSVSGAFEWKYVQQAADIISDNTIHFISFFILGALAQLANNRKNEFIFGISLALITSVFIEFLHFFLPFRSFDVMEGFLNVLGCISAIFLISYLRKINE